MKNKLTPEEEILKAKLNEASFAYQESNWAEMQSIVSKKGFLTNYSPFLKAAVGFSILIGSVLLINEFYPNESNEPNVTEEVIAPTDTENLNQKADESYQLQAEENFEEIASPSVNSNNELSEKAFEQVNPTQTEETIRVEPIISYNEVEEEQPVIEEIQEEIPNIEITALKLISPACLDTEIEALFEHNGSLENNTRTDWYLNDKLISGSKTSCEFKINEARNHKLNVQVYFKENLIATKSITFDVIEKTELDFNAEDLSSPFYDMNVSLNALPEGLKNVRWYVNSPAERVQFNSATAWTFEKEGIHMMTMAHKTDAGCIYDVTKAIEVKKDFNPAFPKQFTPDNDGLNDVFKLEALNVYNTKFLIQVFDQRNKLVYESNDPEEGWNGKLHNNGNLLPKIKYAWQAQIENEHGKKKIYSGKVNMVDFN